MLVVAFAIVDYVVGMAGEILFAEIENVTEVVCIVILAVIKWPFSQQCLDFVVKLDTPLGITIIALSIEVRLVR